MATFAKTIGNDLTAYAYRYQGQRPLGAVEDRFARDGYALAVQHRKFEAVSLVEQGYDTSALSSGGFLQAGWHFSGAPNVYARYDETYDPFDRRRGSATLSLGIARLRLLVSGGGRAAFCILTASLSKIIGKPGRLNNNY